MTPARTWLYLGPAIALAGVMLVVTFGPRAGRAAQEGLDEYETPRTHQLWICKTKVSCSPVGKPKNSTACALDAAAEANALPKGARVACHRVK